MKNIVLYYANTYIVYICKLINNRNKNLQTFSAYETSSITYLKLAGQMVTMETNSFLISHLTSYQVSTRNKCVVQQFSVTVYHKDHSANHNCQFIFKFRRLEALIKKVYGYYRLFSYLRKNISAETR